MTPHPSQLLHLSRAAHSEDDATVWVFSLLSSRFTTTKHCQFLILSELMWELEFTECSNNCSSDFAPFYGTASCHCDIPTAVSLPLSCNKGSCPTHQPLSSLLRILLLPLLPYNVQLEYFEDSYTFSDARLVWCSCNPSNAGEDNTLCVYDPFACLGPRMIVSSEGLL